MNSFGTSLSLIQPSINLFAIFQFLIRNDKFECDSDLDASTFLLYYIIWIFWGTMNYLRELSIGNIPMNELISCIHVSYT